MEPRIQYTHAADGVAIAYAVVGEGPPLLFVRPLFVTGVDDEIARSTQLWPALTDSHSVVLWDIRGQGLSASAPEAGFDDWLADMEAVADAAGADRFDLVGVAVPCHLAMAYAARRPNRVNRMALYSPAPPGHSLRRVEPAWLFALASENWHDFVDMLALRMHGWDSAAAAQRFADRMRAHFTPEQFLRLMDVIESIDATGDAGSIRTPTLVIDDRVVSAQGRREVPTQQFARQLAAAIPGAQLAVIKPGDAPAQVVARFLSGGSNAADTRPDAPTPSGTAIILFADIVDSTALTERMGDAAFRAKARDLDASLRAIISEAGGTTIDAKTLGDGVLATFPSASQAIDAALRCAAAGDAQGLPLHLGLHAGDVIREQNNVFGGAVNIASRISALSAPGEVLVSDIVRGLARTSADVTFGDRGEHALKGVGDPQRVYSVRKDAS
jgi:class 3 adenylate cyclase